MKKCFSLYLVLVFLFGITRIALPQTGIKSTILKGLDSYYNFNWTQSENTFQKLIDKYPDDPRGYHYMSGIYFWYYFSNKDKDDLNKFLEYSDKAIDEAVAKIDTLTDDPDLLYILGANYSYRAMAFTQEGKFLDAVWATKRSESFLKKVIEINPKYYDAYLGLGLYNFALGQIPKAFQWALSIAGMKGDKEKGLTYLQEAVNKGTFTKVEASFYYSQILSDFFADYRKASKFLDNLLQKYPDNLLFSYSLSVVKIRERKLDAANKLLHKIVKASNIKLPQLIALSNFLLGDIQFKQNNFDSATVYYNKFILTTPENDYTGITNYRLAICYELMEQENVATTFFKMTNRGNTDIEDDVYAKRRGEYFSEHNFNQDDKNLVRFNHYIAMSRFKTAIDSLNELKDTTKSEDVKAEAMLNISDALYLLGNYKASADSALLIKSYQIENEKWIEPYSYYFAARAQLKLGNSEGAKRNIEEAEGFKNFDYQNKLKNLLFGIRSKEKY
ncbi:MAG: tetratricopeptide repeat protein [Ignavibacteriaceae bacterium]